MKKIFSFFIVCLFSFAIGCSPDSSQSTKVDLGREFLQEQGYSVIKHVTSVDPFTLSQQDLSKIYQMQVWQVQTVDVEDYLGKEIYGEIFVVRNHVLDNYVSGDTKGLGKTQVSLMIVGDEVIGGTSFPITDELLRGGVYSLDGKTFDELHPNVKWREWADRWQEKYRVEPKMNYDVVKNKVFHVLTREFLQTNDTKNPNVNVLYREYDVYDGKQNSIFQKIDSVSIPKEITNMTEAKSYLEVNSPEWLKLNPITIVSENVINQWKNENYHANFEYWSESPQGLDFEIITQ